MTMKRSNPRVGVHFARICAFTAALTALTTLVVADVLAAEAAEVEAVEVDEGEEDEAPFLRLVARPVVPDAAPAAEPDLAAALAAIEAERAQAEGMRKKKRPAKKIAFGRFEGY